MPSGGLCERGDWRRLVYAYVAVLAGALMEFTVTTVSVKQAMQNAKDACGMWRTAYACRAANRILLAHDVVSVAGNEKTPADEPRNGNAKCAVSVVIAHYPASPGVSDAQGA